MLDQYRKTGRNPVRNAVVIVLFGAITVVFIFWGLMPRQAGSFASGGSVAEVNGELISIADYENERSRISDMYSSMLGQGFNADAERQMLAGQALGGLIQLELVSQASNSQGLFIPKDDIRDQIVNIPVFQKDGRFQKAYYEAYLSHIRSRPAEFEKKLRKVTQYQRANRLFESALSPIGFEAEKQMALNSTKLNVQFLRLNRADLGKSVMIPPAEVQQFASNPQNTGQMQEYYNANQGRFKDKDKTKLFDSVKTEIAQILLQQERAESKIHDLEILVRKLDLKAVEGWALANKIKWDETGDFPLSATRLPKLGENEQFAKAAFALTPEQPLAATLFHEGGAAYVLKLKSRNVAENKGALKEEERQALVATRAREAFSKYIEGLRTSADIRENSDILRQ